MLPFKWNHSGRPIVLIYLPCRVYLNEILFTCLLIYLLSPLRVRGGKRAIPESLHLSEFPDRSFTVSFQNDYMCGVCAPRKGMAFTPSLFLADLGLFRLCAARSVPGLLYSLALRELTCSWGEFDKTIVCFHMTSWRPYLCPKTMKRRPCLCPKPVLWELNSFLM